MSGRGFANAVAPPSPPPELLAARPLLAIDPNLGAAAVRVALDAARAGCAVVAMDFERVPDVVRASRVLVTSRERLLRTGIRGGTAADVRAFAENLVRRGGARTAIVTCGENGCVVADREAGTLNVPVLRVPNIVDTTGAGDTFRAGLCYGLREKWPLARTVRFASAAAALHCTVRGGASRFPLARVLNLAGLPAP